MHDGATEATALRSEESWGLTMRNDYPKALHSTLLQQLGVEATRGFWARHPLCRDGRPFSDGELAAHLEGRYSFSFREFKRLPGFVSHPKNTGFETRLNRLRAALQRAECGLTISLSGRGRFVLEATDRLELLDHPRSPG